MSESGPSIFRSLERTAGRGGFDTIVRAAVAAYAPLLRPTQRQCREFGGLVMPLFDRTDRETRRMLAASLAAAPRLPRPLVERLLREPIEVVAPFLLGSPLLTEGDIALLHGRTEPSLDRLLAARRPTTCEKPSAPQVPTQSPEQPVSETVRRGAARQTSLLSIGSAEDASAGETAAVPSQSPSRPASPTRANAEQETRELLRRMATTGRRAPIEPEEASVDETDEMPDLLDFALRKDSAGFREALARRLLVSTEEAAALMASEGGKPLASALKALGVTLADAMTILMMTSPRIGADVTAFEAMQAHYAALDADACAARFDLLSVPVAAPVRHVPQFEASSSNAPHRASAPTFGRRKPVALDLAARRQGR